MRQIAKLLLATVIAFTASFFLTVGNASAQYPPCTQGNPLSRGQSCVIQVKSNIPLNVLLKSSGSSVLVDFQDNPPSSCTRTVPVVSFESFNCFPQGNRVTATNKVGDRVTIIAQQR